jgi:hypothetical protein
VNNCICKIRLEESLLCGDKNYPRPVWARPEKTLRQNLSAPYWPPQLLLSTGDTVLVVNGYASLLAPNFQNHLPKSIIVTIANREGLEQITKGVFLRVKVHRGKQQVSIFKWFCRKMFSPLRVGLSRELSRTFYSSSAANVPANSWLPVQVDLKRRGSSYRGSAMSSVNSCKAYK